MGNVPSGKIAEPKRILIVDDDLLSCEILKVMLSKYGTCDIVQDSLDAVGLVVDSAIDNKLYDLIVVDYVMPGINGGLLTGLAFNAITFVSSKATPKVFMVSGNVLEGVLSCDEYACYDEFIEKPVQAKLVDELMHKYFSQNSPQMTC